MRTPRGSARDTRAAGASHGGPQAAWRGPAAWSLAGFLVGIVFWHVVGFWGFVSKAVFKGRPETEVAAVEPLKPDRTLDGDERAQQAAPAARCIELKLDRATGAIAAGSCQDFGHLIKAGPVASRGDLAFPRLQLLVPSVAGWSTGILDTTGRSGGGE